MSTPSATALSMAFARSEVLQLARVSPGRSQQALYTATRARGAMPSMPPISVPKIDACTRVAGSRRCRVRAVAVHVARRANLARVDRPGILGAADEPACADQLVVAVGLVETLARFADAVPVLRRLEDELVFHFVVAAAQPAPEKRNVGPGAAARARPVGFLRVRQGGMFGVDAAVDETDDDAVAVQSFRAAQSAIRVEEPQETGAEIGRQRPDLVFPDVQDVGHVLELVRLRGSHLRRKAVEAVAIAVDLARIAAQRASGTGPAPHAIFRHRSRSRGWTCRVAVGTASLQELPPWSCRAWSETRRPKARAAARCIPCGHPDPRRPQAASRARCRRRAAASRSTHWRWPRRARAKDR